MLLLLSSVMMLTGCTASTLPEFDAEQTDRDVIPEGPAQPEIDLDSTRYVGEVEGAQLYLAHGGNDGICLIHIRDQEWEQTGCGAGDGMGSELESGTLIEVGSFRFPEDKAAGGQRTRLSESVSVISYP